MAAPSLRCGVALQEVSFVFGVVLDPPAAVSCAIVLKSLRSLKRHEATFCALANMSRFAVKEDGLC